MTILDKKFYKDVFKSYINTKFFFPIISAVLEGSQEGIVVSNNNIKPTSFFIIHKFGFAQFFEKEEDNLFDQLVLDSIIDTSICNNINKVEKLRIYYSHKKWSKKFDKLELSFISKSKRTRFSYNNKSIESFKNEDYQIIPINLSNIELINRSFDIDICKRFWISCNDAVINSKALILNNNKFLSICYAAAVSNNFAEIDIFTNNDFRNKGFAELIAKEFIIHCTQENIVPMWDCYSNNLPSYNLATKLNFELKFEYTFYTINILKRG